MTQSLNLLETGAALLKRYTSEELAEINLDEIIGWIKAANENLIELQHANAQLDLLRAEIIGRMSGMTKAIAVTRNQPAALEEAAEFVSSLENMEASQLIATYNRLCARFRETFPSSSLPGGANVNARSSSKKSISG